MSSRRSPRLLAGDVSRLLRESLKHVHGTVALVTVTAPGGIEVCPCCGETVRVRLRSPEEVAAWNRTFGERWRRINSRIRSDMHREGTRPPRVVAWVAQRQGRGADHLHPVYLARTPDELQRLAGWVGHYRRLHVKYGLGFVDDPVKPRNGGRDMLFESAQIAGAYLGKYLTGGQLERFLAGDDRSLRGWWISPVLLAASGWSMARCSWVRQAHRLRMGTWDRRTWYGTAWLPSWWLDGQQRAWVLAVTGWDGIVATSPRSLVVGGQGYPA